GHPRHLGAVARLDLQIRGYPRPAIDLQLGAVQREAVPSVLLVGLGRVTELAQQSVGDLEVTDLRLGLPGTADGVRVDLLDRERDPAPGVAQTYPPRRVPGLDVVHVAPLKHLTQVSTTLVENEPGRLFGVDVQDLGLVFDHAHVVEFPSLPCSVSGEVVESRWSASSLPRST